MRTGMFSGALRGLWALAALVPLALTDNGYG